MGRIVTLIAAWLIAVSLVIGVVLILVSQPRPHVVLTALLIMGLIGALATLRAAVSDG